MTKLNLKNSILLFLTAFIWGVAFVAQSKGGDSMGTFAFVSLRNVLGAVVLLPVIFGSRAIKKKQGNPPKKLDMKITVIGGICCGAALTAASLFQQFGIELTTVGKSGFITALYIIFTPIIGIFIGRKASPIVWVGAVIAVFGMYLLCISEQLTLQLGDLLVLICSVLFAVHILVIDYFSPKTDGVVLSCIQFAVSAVICGILSLIFEPLPTVEQLENGLIPLLYLGIMSSGVAYTLQIIGQKNMNPTVAALILSLESVISSIAGYFAYKVGYLTTDQTMTARQVIGCAIVFAAVILVQIPFKRKKST